MTRGQARCAPGGGAEDDGPDGGAGEDGVPLPDGGALVPGESDEPGGPGGPPWPATVSVHPARSSAATTSAPAPRAPLIRWRPARVGRTAAPSNARLIASVSAR